MSYEWIGHFMMYISEPIESSIRVLQIFDKFNIFSGEVCCINQLVSDVHKGSEVSLSVGVWHSFLFPRILGDIKGEVDTIHCMGGNGKSEDIGFCRGFEHMYNVSARMGTKIDHRLGGVDVECKLPYGNEAVEDAVRVV